MSRCNSKRKVVLACRSTIRFCDPCVLSWPNRWLKSFRACSARFGGVLRGPSSTRIFYRIIADRIIFSLVPTAAAARNLRNRCNSSRRSSWSRRALWKEIRRFYPQIYGICTDFQRRKNIRRISRQRSQRTHRTEGRTSVNDLLL